LSDSGFQRRVEDGYVWTRRLTVQPRGLEKQNEKKLTVANTWGKRAAYSDLVPGKWFDVMFAFGKSLMGEGKTCLLNGDF